MKLLQTPLLAALLVLTPTLAFSQSSLDTNVGLNTEAIDKQRQQVQHATEDKARTSESLIAYLRDQRVIAVRRAADVNNLDRAIRAERDRKLKLLDEQRELLKKELDDSNLSFKTIAEVETRLIEIDRDTSQSDNDRRQGLERIKDILAPVGRRYEELTTLRRRVLEARFRRADIGQAQAAIDAWMDQIPSASRTQFNELDTEVQGLSRGAAESKAARDTARRVLSLFKDVASTEKSNEDLSGIHQRNQSNQTASEYLVRDIDDWIISFLSRIQNKDFYAVITTALFGFTIALVISSFFFIAYRSKSVQDVIFKNDSGLQFVTLFSLIIAIVLFGVLKILEGKELSALLGGLSGYILGRGSISSGRPGANDQQPEPAPTPTPPSPAPSPPAPVPTPG